MSKGKSGFRRPRGKQQHWHRNSLLSVAAALAIVAVPVYLQTARAQQAAPVSAAPAAPAGDFGRFRARPARPVLRHLPQPALEDRGPVARSAGPRAHARPRRDLGKSRAQAARRNDASGGHAASGSAGARIHDHFGWRTNWTAARSPNLTSAGPAPPQPHRIYECDSRPAGARSGRHEIPAGRRFDSWLRQHRRGADAVSGTDGGVFVGCGKDQPSGDWRCVGADAGRLRGARGHRAELSHRGTAVRNPRRHPDQISIPCRRRIYVQGQRRHGLLPGCPGWRQGRATRGHGRWRAGEAVRLGQGNCEYDRQRPRHATHPGQGGPAHRGRDIPRHQRRAGQRTEQTVSADHEHAGLHTGISVLSARRPGLD